MNDFISSGWNVLLCDNGDPWGEEKGHPWGDSAI